MPLLLLLFRARASDVTIVDFAAEKNVSKEKGIDSGLIEKERKNSQGQVETGCWPSADVTLRGMHQPSLSESSTSFISHKKKRVQIEYASFPFHPIRMGENHLV